MTNALASVIAATVIVAAAEAAKPPAVPQPLGAAEPISGCSDCQTWPPSLEATHAGQVLVGWHLLHDDLHYTLDLFGTDARLSSHITTLAANTFLKPVGAGRDGDEWVVAWEVDGAIFLQRFRDDGSAATAARRLNPDLPAGQDDTGVLMEVREGRVLVTWLRTVSADGPNPIMAAWFDRDGNRLGDELTLGESFGLVVQPTCIRKDGSAVVLFGLIDQPVPQRGAPPSAILVRRLGASGPIGAATLVSPTMLVPQGRYFNLSCAPDGSYAVAWNVESAPAKVGSDILLQRFDAAGKPRGKTVIVNSGLDGDQVRPEVMFRNDGSSIVVWLSREAGGDLIEGRRINKQGRVLGKDFVLHSGPSGTLDSHSTIRPPEGGRFALGWWERRVGMLRWFSD